MSLKDGSMPFDLPSGRNMKVMAGDPADILNHMVQAMYRGWWTEEAWDLHVVELSFQP
jgi:hypothetical protein